MANAAINVKKRICVQSVAGATLALEYGGASAWVQSLCVSFIIMTPCVSLVLSSQFSVASCDCQYLQVMRCEISSDTGSPGHQHYMTLRYTFTTMGSWVFSSSNGFVRGWIIRKLFLEIRERFSPDLLPLSCSDHCGVARWRKQMRMILNVSFVPNSAETILGNF